MADLTGQAVQDRYKDLLQVSNTNSGIDATLRDVEDGEGTASTVQMSTTAFNVKSGLELNGTSGQTGAVLKHEVGGLEFDANAIADGGVIVGTASGTMAIRASFLTAGAAGFIKHELGGLEIDISGITTDEFLVGQSAGVIARRTAAQSRTHLGLVIGTDVLAPTGDGSGLTGIGFPSGTVMLFHQSAAPTGWTKTTASTLNNSALRVVTSTAWGSGKQGATAFTSVFGSSKTAGAHTLSTDRIPSHSHVQQHRDVAVGTAAPEGLSDAGAVISSGISTQATGGGSSHNHTLSLDLNYINMIIATKD